MRIITPVKNYFIYFVVLVSLLGFNSAVYSQCPTVTNLNQSFCNIQSPTISSLAASSNGGGVSWFANATGGTALLATTGLVNGEDYFADDATGACGTRQRVIVTVYSAPTGANFQGVCVTSLNQATPSNPQFVISGNNLRWYTTSSGGTPISNATILTDNTIYYISQTNPDTGCETSRLQLFVNVGLVPIPTGSAVQEFCNVTGNPPTVADLLATGNNNWYLTSTFGVPLDLSTPLVNGQFYYATSLDPPCESSDRLEVLVTIYEPNDAGNDGSRSLCVNQIPTTLPFNLFNLVGGTPDATGVWSGPIATTNGSQGTLNPSALTLAGSPYVFTYTVSSALCATDASIVTIIINPTPTVTVTSPPVCQGTLATVTATVSPAGTYNYVWTVPAGATNPGNVATFTTTIAGVYSVIAISISTTCPSQPAQTTVIVNPRPTVTITSPPVCQGSLATVTATATPAGTYNYVWTVPSGAANPGNVASFTTTTAGVYSVVITNPTTTCSSLPVQTTVVINPIPTVTVTSPPVCQGTPATVTATATPSASYSYVWTVPSGASNPGNVGSFLTNTPGIYSVIATNTTTTCPSLPAQTNVVINPRPTVTVTSLAVCQGIPAPVIATATPIGIYTYTWTVPAGATNPGNVAAFVTTTPGVYSVIITNPVTTCPSLPAQTTVVINPRPVVTVTSPPVCQGTPATVTATATPAGTYTYIWTVPAGATNPGNVATFTTTVPGVYSVIAINTITTCPSLPAQTTVVINPIPTVTVTSPPVCQGTPATVTATATPAGTYTYIWTVPAGATNPGNVATFTTTVPGVYSVVAINTITTCPSLPAQTTVVINPRPVVTVTSPPVCQGTPATVTATATPAGTYTYIWTVPAGATNPGNVATFTTTVPGVYSVVATNTTSTCPSLPAQTTVVINPTPTVIITSPTVCEGTPSTVTATATPSGTYTYIWTVPAGATNPGNVATFTTTIAGVYSVIATNAASTCPSQPAQTTVVINPKPTVTVTSSPVCQGILATVTATPLPAGIYTYVWTVPAGATNPGNVATFTTATVGIYSVIVTNPTTTCPSLPAQTTVVISPSPTLTVTSPPVCQGTPATVTVTPNPAGTYTYGWTFPAGASNPGNTATFTTTIPGVYSVIATNTTTTCPSLPAQTTVVINPAPDAGTNGTKTFCSNTAPEDLLLSLGGTPQAGGIWTPTLANGDGVFDPVVDASGTYTYTIVGIAPCVDATATVTVNVIEEPQAGNDGELIVCSDSPSEDLFLILGPGTQTGGTWSPAMASGTGVFNPAVDPQGDYTYTVTGTPPCASDTAVVSVTVNLAPDAGTNGTKTFCSNTAPEDLLLSLGGTPQAGGIWTPTLANGDGVFDPVVDASGTYTYTIVGIAPCVDATATVTVNVIEEPQAGNDGELIVCANSPSEDLFLILGLGTQTGGTWSPGMASGTGVFNPAVDPQGDYTYTITGTPPCASDIAVVTVTVNPLPDAGTDGSLAICSNQNPVDLFASLQGTPQTGGTWSPTLASGTGVFNPAVDPQGDYTYTITGTAPCANDTAVVTVTVNLAPDAGTTGTKTFCSNAAPEDLLLSLAGTPQVGGIWTPTLSNGDGVFDPVVDASGTYTYTIVGIAPCVDATATVTVNVIEEPQAGNDGELIVCADSPSEDLFLILGLGTQTGGTWSPALASGTGVFDPALDAAGEYTYTIAGTSPCASDSAVVTVLVNPIPNAGTNGSLAICSNQNPVDLFDSLQGTPQAGGIWTPTLASGTGVFDPVVDVAGTYTYTVSGIAPCTDATASATVVVTDEPQAGNDGELIVCADSPSEDLFLILGLG
ncbi:hypothetical protein, partial [Flavobacterium sp.]|uniref:beta strand repeat-containing protein n=1 Tax=Flavobacterium sp. TaxID=239 RepID=UPI002489541F